MSTPANDGTQPRGIPTEGTPTEYDPTVPEVDTSKEHLAAIVTNAEYFFKTREEITGFKD